MVLTPVVDGVEAWLRLYGFIPPQLEDVLPWLFAYPLLSFFLYLVLEDFVDYWRHRLQHAVPPWWALHSLHHSQRQLSLWADDRNHLLDDVIKGLWATGLAWVIGVPPGQFVAWIMVTRVVESLSHANVRLSFGTLGSRLLVGPQFHRVHHAMSLGHEGRHHGCNFATLFPAWDILFGTANFTRQYVTTGIADQLQGQDYGETVARQQWLGVQRLVTRIWRS
jgi:sterol desaturase/sphingolipid hydroxylase (fatty acid hydroxylase superfamily)